MSSLGRDFESFAVSHAGYARELNEDRYLVEPGSGLWLVADGMGGHEAGEVASASIVEHLATTGVASSAVDLRARFEDRLFRAHSEIRSIATARGQTIGSTVAALLAFEDRYACLWSGDSRVYLVRDGAIAQLSRDHTEVQELLDGGILSPDEARNWPRNVITRAIGVGEEIVLDVQQGEFRPNDMFVLGTDGLSNHVSEEEIGVAATTRGSPRAVCEALLETVLARGASDNVTVVVVRRLGEADAAR